MSAAVAIEAGLVFTRSGKYGRNPAHAIRPTDVSSRPAGLGQFRSQLVPVVPTGSGRVSVYAAVGGWVSWRWLPLALIGGWSLAAARQPAGYDPVRDTISALAARDAADSWIMTTGLAILGVCHMATAGGLSEAGGTARALLAAGGERRPSWSPRSRSPQRVMCRRRRSASLRSGCGQRSRWFRIVASRAQPRSCSWHCSRGWRWRSVVTTYSSVSASGYSPVQRHCGRSPSSCYCLRGGKRAFNPAGMTCAPRRLDRRKRLINPTRPRLLTLPMVRKHLIGVLDVHEECVEGPSLASELSPAPPSG